MYAIDLEFYYTQLRQVKQYSILMNPVNAQHNCVSLVPD